MRTGRGITGAAGRQRVREAAAAAESGRTVPIEMPRAKGSVLSAVGVRGEVVIDFWWRAVVTTLARRNIPARLSREVRPRCRDHRSPATTILHIQYRVGWYCSLLSRLQALEFVFAVCWRLHTTLRLPRHISATTRRICIFCAAATLSRELQRAGNLACPATTPHVGAQNKAPVTRHHTPTRPPRP